MKKSHLPPIDPQPYFETIEWSNFVPMTEKTSRPKRKQSRNKTNFYLDLALTVLFVIEMEVYFTGLALHELIGLLFAVLLTIHVVLHWKWVVSLTRTFFKKLLHESRLNYVLNVALFVDLLVVTLSGLVIARTLGYAVSLSTEAMSNWLFIHVVSSHLSLILIALHVALHWKWIVTNSKKILFGSWSALGSTIPRGSVMKGANRFAPLRLPLWSLTFLLFVIISGSALTNMGYTENPFESIAAAVEIQQMSWETALEPEATFAADMEIVLPEQEIGKESDWQITWSAFGDVLYDLWFLCAATIFVLLIRYPVGWLVRRIQQKS